MNTRKLFYGVLAILVLAFSACTNDSSDELYDGVDKRYITKDNKSVDKRYITKSNKSSVDKRFVTSKPNN